ncbi:MAG: DMT family transporter [archaeon]
MNTFWFLFAAFGAMLSWGVGDFLIQKSVRKVGDIEALAFIGLIGFIGLTPFVIGDLNLLFVPQNFGILIGLGVLSFITAIFTLESFKRGKLSVVDVVLEFELPITIIVCFFLFGEFLLIHQMILIIPIFVGIILISLKKGVSIKKSHFFEKGVLFALAAAIGLGVVNSFTAFGSREISPLLVIWIPWLVVFIISFFVIFSRKDIKTTFKNAFKFKWLLLGMGIIDTLAWVFYAYAMQDLNVGIVTAITESYPVIGIIFGVFLNREKIGWRQVLGAILTIGASIALGITLL